MAAYGEFMKSILQGLSKWCEWAIYIGGYDDNIIKNRISLQFFNFISSSSSLKAYLFDILMSLLCDLALGRQRMLPDIYFLLYIVVSKSFRSTDRVLVFSTKDDRAVSPATWSMVAWKLILAEFTIGMCDLNLFEETSLVYWSLLISSAGLLLEAVASRML